MRKPKFRRVVLILMFVTWIVCYMDRMIMSVSIPSISAEFGLNPVSMGVVMSAFLLGYALIQIPGGIMADKVGPKVMMVISLFLWSLLTGITGLAASLTVLLVIRVLFGMAEGLFPGGYYKLIANWFPIKERATANGIAYSAQPFGIALASVAGAGIIVAFGWRTSYYLLVIPGLICCLLLWILVSNSPSNSKYVTKEELEDYNDDPQSEQEKKKANGGYGSVLKMPIIWKLSLTWFFFSIANWGFISWLPSYLVQARGFETMRMGFAVALPFLASAIGLATGGFISDKLFANKRKLCFSISMLTAALTLFIALRATNVTFCVTMITISGYFLSVGMAGFWAIPMVTIPKEVMGLAASTISFCGISGGFTAPILTGFLIQASGNNYNYVLIIIMLAMVITVPCMLTIKNSSMPELSAKPLS